ncbi:MAG: hypothetical protein HQL13_04785 [Candidatus Omnitrophica bacterium]|nr:hypothetical protein [Candidatus Omnitrophota bacterium]
MVPGILLAAFLLKLYYIFHFTTWQQSLNFDMAAYWNGAMQKALGQPFSLDQFAIFPPFFMYFLGTFIQWPMKLGFGAHILPMVIVFNVLLQCLSAYIVYLVLHKITGRQLMAWAGLIFYIFSYTSLYFNALVLPDNMAVSVLVMITGLVFLFELNGFVVFCVGFLLGVIVSAKPLFVGFLPVFIWRVLSSSKTKVLFKAFILMAALSIVPLWTVMENYHNSHGEIIGLSVNGGVNFFEGWGQCGKINSQGKAGSYWVYSPGAMDEPSWKPFNTVEPIYHQGYFYKLGIDAILKNPIVLVKKMLWFKKLFFGDLAPTLSQEPLWYCRVMPMIQYMLYGMLLGAGVLFVLPLNFKDYQVIRFLWLLLLSLVFTVYCLGMPERRYLYYIEFGIVILFFAAVDKIVELHKIYKKEILIYLLVIFSIFVCVPCAYKMLVR